MMSRGQGRDLGLCPLFCLQCWSPACGTGLLIRSLGSTPAQGGGFVGASPIIEKVRVPQSSGRRQREAPVHRRLMTSAWVTSARGPGANARHLTRPEVGGGRRRIDLGWEGQRCPLPLQCTCLSLGGSVAGFAASRAVHAGIPRRYRRDCQQQCGRHPSSPSPSLVEMSPESGLCVHLA